MAFSNFCDVNSPTGVGFKLQYDITEQRGDTHWPFKKAQAGPRWCSGKEPACQQETRETLFRSLGQEDPLG